MSKPKCFNCNDKRTRNTKGTRLMCWNTPRGFSNGTLNYFCSKNCATQFIEEQLSLNHRWDKKKEMWRTTQQIMKEYNE